MGVRMGCYIFLVVLMLVWRIVALDCKNDPSFTIRSIEDVSSINKCTFFNGSVVISSNELQDIEFKGLRSIRALEATSANKLRSISSISLESIDKISLSALPNLASLNFTALTILEAIRLENLPSFENCSFGLGPRKDATIFNTSLQSVEWLKWPVSNVLNITSNANLESISFPWEAIDSDVTISSNPALNEVDVLAVEALTGSLTMKSNNELKELRFKRLQDVKGEVEINGMFTNISMPVLKTVDGKLSVKSSENISEYCGGLSKKNLKGEHECESGVEEKSFPSPVSTSTSHPDSDPTSNSAPSSGEPLGQQDEASENDSDLALGAKIGVIIASIVFAIFICVGIFFFIRARIRGKVMEIVPSTSGTVTSSVVPKAEKTVKITRLEGKTVRVVKINLNGREIEEVDDGTVDGRAGNDKTLTDSGQCLSISDWPADD